MNVAKENTLFCRTVEVSEDYLGPAAERFIRRRITTHLGIEPEKLNKKQLPLLVDWIRLAFAMLTSDAKEVENFTHSLLALSKSTNLQ